MSDEAPWPDDVMPPPSEQYQRERGWKDGKPPPNGVDHAPETDLSALREAITLSAWIKRDLPKPECLLGDVLTTTTRMFLVGQTGLGKTLVGLAIAGGAAFAPASCTGARHDHVG
jgi:hypothetical protein